MTRIDREIRARRGAKLPVDPRRPLGAVTELERRPGGAVETGRTLFLAGSECPFTCVFCDLWRHTLDTPTPRGALPRQIEHGLAGARPEWRWVKLYNASNFFDVRAVPPEDHEAIARAVDEFPRVVVESHPRLLGPACRSFAERLTGRLEVAIGLETVHPEALGRLNKRVELRDFDASARWLRAAGIGLRVFVLLGAPFVPWSEQLRWTLASVRHALAEGAGTVSIVPVRPFGELDRLAARGLFRPPPLDLAERALEAALELCSGGEAVVQLDPWDLERLEECDSCGPLRRQRLARMNLSGRTEERVRCGRCGGGEAA